eukprot:scaffold53384_cov34-Tisochrysis_lutea.AAC.3
MPATLGYTGVKVRTPSTRSRQSSPPPLAPASFTSQETLKRLRLPQDNMFTPNNELRDPRVARKLRIELRRERLVQAEVLDQIRKLRNVLNLSPSMDSLPLGSAASPQSHGDPFLRSYGERAADRCRKGTDKDGISVINSSLGTMRPPAFPDPAWTPPKTGARSRPTTPTVVSSLRPRVQLYKDAVEGALVAAAAQSGGLLEVKTMQAALESAGVRISQLQVRATAWWQVMLAPCDRARSASGSRIASLVDGV